MPINDDSDVLVRDLPHDHSELLSLIGEAAVPPRVTPSDTIGETRNAKRLAKTPKWDYCNIAVARVTYESHTHDHVHKRRDTR